MHSLKQALCDRRGASDGLQPLPRTGALLRDDGPWTTHTRARTPLRRLQPVDNACWGRDTPEELQPLEDPAGAEGQYKQRVVKDNEWEGKGCRDLTKKVWECNVWWQWRKLSLGRGRSRFRLKLSMGKETANSLREVFNCLSSFFSIPKSVIKFVLIGNKILVWHYLSWRYFANDNMTSNELKLDIVRNFLMGWVLK